MENGDWFLLAVVVVAFIAGYSVVSFIAKKMKSDAKNGNPAGAQTSSQAGTFPNASDEDDEQKEQNEESTREDRYRQWKQEQARRRTETW